MKRYLVIPAFSLLLVVFGEVMPTNAQVWSNMPEANVGTFHGPVKSVTIYDSITERKGWPPDQAGLFTFSASYSMRGIAKSWGFAESWGFAGDSAPNTRISHYNGDSCLTETIMYFTGHGLIASRPKHSYTQHQLYEYSSTGRPISIRTYIIKDDTNFREIKFGYDSINRARSAETFDAIGKRIQRTDYHYGYNGEFEVQKDSTDNAGNIVRKFQRVDANQSLMLDSLVVLNAADQMVLSKISIHFINDKGGNPILRIRDFGADAFDTTMYTYTYDSHGNWIERREFFRDDPNASNNGANHSWHLAQRIIVRHIQYYSSDKQLQPCRVVLPNLITTTYFPYSRLD